MLLWFSAHHENPLPNRRSRVRKVATLARSSERGRALASARSAPPVPVTQQVLQEIKSLYPADPDPAVPVQTPVSNLFLSQVADLVPGTLRRMSRLGEPGPLGMRAEHWYDFGEQAGDCNVFVQLVAHIAAAEVPNPVLQYLRSGQVTPLAKPTGGHRPLPMMCFLRRLALKSAMAARKESVAKCACWSSPTPWSKQSSISQKLIQLECLLPLTSRLPSRMSLVEPCYTALNKVTRTLLVSSPNGTQAPPSTGCTSSPPTPRSLPTAALTKDVPSPLVASLRSLRRLRTAVFVCVCGQETHVATPCS